MLLDALALVDMPVLRHDRMPRQLKRDGAHERVERKQRDLVHFSDLVHFFVNFFPPNMVLVKAAVSKPRGKIDPIPECHTRSGPRTPPTDGVRQHALNPHLEQSATVSLCKAYAHEEEGSRALACDDGECAVSRDAPKRLQPRLPPRTPFLSGRRHSDKQLLEFRFRPFVRLKIGTGVEKKAHDLDLFRCKGTIRIEPGEGERGVPDVRRNFSSRVDPSALFQKEENNIDEGVATRVVEQGELVTTSSQRVDRSPSVNQEAHDLKVGTKSRDMKRTTPAAFRVDLGASIEEKADCVDVPVFRRQVKRGLIVNGLRVNVGLLIKQVCDHVDPAVASRKVERSERGRSRRIDIGTFIEKAAHEPKVAVATRIVERGPIFFHFFQT